MQNPLRNNQFNDYVWSINLSCGRRLSKCSILYVTEENISGTQSAVSTLSREYHCSVMMCFYSVILIPSARIPSHNPTARWFTSPATLWHVDCRGHTDRHSKMHPHCTALTHIKSVWALFWCLAAHSKDRDYQPSELHLDSAKWSLWNASSSAQQT